jgi:uncharacterized lipoprotein YmbA
MRKTITACCAIGCAAALALGACQSGPTRIHDLEPAAPATRIDTYQAPPLRVDTLSVPASWDRIEMLRLSSSGDLQISDFNHWSAPLAQIARQTLSDDLDQRLPSGSVIYPRLPKPDGALGINVDILEFTLTTTQASMRASWLIVPTVGAQNTTRSVASVHVSLNSTEPEAVAHAWSLLMGQLADHIAADAASSYGLPVQ